MASFLNPRKLTEMIQVPGVEYAKKSHFFLLPDSAKPVHGDQAVMEWTDKKTGNKESVTFRLNEKVGQMFNLQVWGAMTEKEYQATQQNSAVTSDPLWAEFLQFKQFKAQMNPAPAPNMSHLVPQIPLPVSPIVNHPTVQVQPVGQMTEAQARANARVLLGMQPYGPGRPSAQQLKLEGLFQAGALDPVFTNYAQ